MIKVSRPDHDMRFDVPVVGLDTLLVLKDCNVSALAIDAEYQLQFAPPDPLLGNHEQDHELEGR